LRPAELSMARRSAGRSPPWRSRGPGGGERSARITWSARTLFGPSGAPCPYPHRSDERSGSPVKPDHCLGQPRVRGREGQLVERRARRRRSTHADFARPSPDGPKKRPGRPNVIWRCVRRPPGPRLRQGGLRPLKRRAIEELGIGAQLEAPPQVASRSWRRPDAGRPGTASWRPIGDLSSPGNRRVASPVAAASSCAMGSTRPPELWRAAAWGTPAPTRMWGTWRGQRSRPLRPCGPGHARVERAGDRCPRAFPRPQPERLLLVLPRRAVPRVRRLRAVRQRNVHFAGEHTSTEFQGFMEGRPPRASGRPGRSWPTSVPRNAFRRPAGDDRRPARLQTLAGVGIAMCLFLGLHGRATPGARRARPADAGRAGGARGARSGPVARLDFR